MFGNGLEKEVIIKILPRVAEVAPSMFSAGGVREYDYERLIVWADRGYAERFSKINGVLEAKTMETPNQYLVCVDPRYNLKWVIAEIEAVAKTEKPARKKKDVAGVLSGWPSITFTLKGTGEEQDDEPKPHKKSQKRKPRNKK